MVNNTCFLEYRGRKLKPETDEDAAYDRAARELVFEAKGQVGQPDIEAMGHSPSQSQLLPLHGHAQGLHEHET